MYHDTYYDYKQSVLKDFYEKQMLRHKERAILNISKVASIKQECLLKILASSFLEEHADAVNLANELNLGKLEFLSILDDYDGFREEYIRDQELAQNF